MVSHDDHSLECVSQNPYRILGVTSNTPKKDIIANANKYRAFLKVGKSISSPFDTIPGINRVERSIENIISAEKAIELPIDQLRWGLFWFVNISPIDKVALNHVQSGNIGKAIEIWSKVESVSSLINIVVSELIQQNWTRAALYADKLFSKYVKSICALVSETLVLSQKQLINLFLDTISQGNDDVLQAMYRSFPLWHSLDELSLDSEYRFLSKPQDTEHIKGIHYPCVEVKNERGTVYYSFPEGEELTENEFNLTKDSLAFVYSSFHTTYKCRHIYNRENLITPSQLWNTCICNKLAVPHIEKINRYLATYKAIPKKLTEERYKYAKSVLINSLNEIQNYLGDNSADYQSINIQIIKESLQCAIDYFNSSQEPDIIAWDVKDFVWSILTLATPGSVLRQRCQENYDTLCDICSKLPPASVLYYHKLVKDNIEKYNEEPSTIQNASFFIKKCYPYLMSIKSILGSSNTYYLRICTQVAEVALEDIIIDYNKQSDSLRNRLEKASGSNRSNIIKQIQEMMKASLIAMYHLKQLGLESDFRQNRFNKNYEIIVDQAKNARAIGAENSAWTILDGEVTEEDINNALKKYNPDFRDENGYYSSISNLQDCYAYRRIFPNGKFTNQVNSKVEEYEYKECASLEALQQFVLRYPLTKYDIDAKREEIIFSTCTTIDDYQSYIAKYSTYKKEAEQRLDNLIFNMCQDKVSLEHYLVTYPNGSHVLEAQHKIEDIDFRACKTADDFEKHMKTYPQGYHWTDAQKRMEEERFWTLCNKKDSWKLYKEYLSKYPYGRYSSEAKNKSRSPMQNFNEWRSNNGCLFIIIIILLIAIVIAGITNGIEGIGYVFAAIGVIGVFGSLGKGDIGCGARIASLGIGIVAGGIGYGLISIGEDISIASTAKKLYNSLDLYSSVKDYRNVVTSYYQNLNVTQQDDIINRYYYISLDSCIATIGKYSIEGYNSKMSGLGYLKDFIECCPNYTYKEQAQIKINDLVDSLYYVAKRKNTFTGWNEYQNSVSSDDYRDSDKRKEAVDPRWNNDRNAWKTALSLNNIAAYERYLSLYPNGKHRAEADEKVIDLTVAMTFAGEHSSLPQMDKIGYGEGSTSYVSVTNRTSYTLTLMYSGNESKRLVLSPNSSGTLRLKNGSYKIAASVNASNVNKYAGIETLNGGTYEVEYYISTYRHY